MTSFDKQTWGQERGDSLALIHALIPMLMAVLVILHSCLSGPISQADKRKYFGDSFIYQEAPFCCIYVGLNANERELFATNFWRFAGQHGIHTFVKTNMHATWANP
jgi:hypothetical protein